MRIRTIKPEFWRSDDIDGLDWGTRLVFIGLWSYVDDNGVGLDKLAAICADLFAADLERDPRETFARVSDALQTFAETGLIQRYTVDGKAYLFVTGWTKHQRVDKPNKPRYPTPTSENAVVRDTLATPSRKYREDLAPGTEEQRNRGTEEKEICSPAPPSNETPSAAPTSKKASEPIGFAEFWSAYPRRQNKGAAIKAYWNALKKVEAAVILDGAHRYAADPNRKDEFTAHASTWLNGERWSDEPLPRQGDRASPAVPRSDQKFMDTFNRGEDIKRRLAANQVLIPGQKEIAG